MRADDDAVSKAGRIKGRHWTLCQSCQQAQIVTTTRGVMSVRCNAGMEPFLVEAPIAECSRYDPEGQMSKYDAKEIGWLLERKPNGRIGFKPPKVEP